MGNDIKHFEDKWTAIIPKMPQGGEYRFDLRQYGHDIIKEQIESGSSVFDFACGLAVIDEQLQIEKGCTVAGCDFSEVAIDYSIKTTNGDFRKTDKIFGTKYDYVLAIQFLEHIKEPCKWLDECFEKTDTIICALPNNFRKTGEHVDMQWSSWEQFNNLFSAYNVERIDIGKYPDRLHQAFRHPIFKFTQKEKKYAPVNDTRPPEETIEKSNQESDQGNQESGQVKQKRKRRTRAEMEASR